VNGTGNYSHTATYAAALQSNGFIQTTTTDVRSYTANTYTQNLAHTITLPLTFKVTPNPGFRFGVSVTPSLYLSNSSYGYTSKTRSTTVVDNGNGVAAATDSGDPTTVVNTVQQPSTQSTDKLTFTVATGAATQIYLKPNKIRLNIGALATTTAVNRKTTTTTPTGVYTQTTDTTKAGVTTHAVNSTAASALATAFGKSTLDSNPLLGTLGTSVSYNAGITYFLNPNVTFDFIVANSKAYNLTATDSDGGFFNLNNYSIQLTIKLPPSSK
jgi:hypothetical protein